MNSSDNQRYSLIYDMAYKSFKLQEEDHFHIVQKTMVLLTIIIPFNSIVLGILFNFSDRFIVNQEELLLTTILFFIYIFIQVFIFALSFYGFRLQSFKRLALEEDMDKFLIANEEQLYKHYIYVLFQMYKLNKKNLEDIINTFGISFYLFIVGIIIYVLLCILIFGG